MNSRLKAVLLLFFLLFTQLYAKETIILTSQDLPPLGSYDSQGNYDGIAVRVVRFALDKMEQDYQIQVFPWARAQIEFKTGKADGFFAASQNAERDSLGVMSEIIADQIWTWYLLKDSPLDPFSDNFKATAAVGSYIGANMLQWLTENNFNVAGRPVDTEGLFKMLLTGRLDAILANNLVAEEIINRDGITDLLKQYRQQSHPLGVYFSKAFLAENPTFLEEFNFWVREYHRLQ